MVIKNSKKPQPQPTKDKTIAPTILNDEDPDNEPDDADEDDIEEIKDDDTFDKDLIRIIRKHHPKKNFLDWLTLKRNRSSAPEE